jgi:hypothetical protein
MALRPVLAKPTTITAIVTLPEYSGGALALAYQTDFDPMTTNTMTPTRLVRLNLHLRPDHLDRLTHLAIAVGKKQCRDARLAEAMDLALTAGLTWDDSDLLDLVKPDREDPKWLALGPIVRTR